MELFDEVYFTDGNSSNELANWLSEQPAGPLLSEEDIVGYIAKNGFKVKFQLSTRLMVVYNDDGVVSLYKVKPGMETKIFNSEKYGFYTELTENIILAGFIDLVSNYICLIKDDISKLPIDKLNQLRESVKAANNINWGFLGKDDEVCLYNLKLIDEVMNDNFKTEEDK